MAGPWEQYQKNEPTQKPWEAYAQPQKPTSPQADNHIKTQREGWSYNIEDALGKRFDTAVEIYGKNKEGTLSGPEAALGMLARVGAGSVNDIIGITTSSAIGKANDLTGGYAGDALKSALGYISGIETGTDQKTVGGELSKAMTDAVGAYKDFSEQNPRTANLAESLGNTVNLIPNAVLSKSIVKGLASGGKTLVSGAKTLAPKAIGGVTKLVHAVDDAAIDPLVQGASRSIAKAALPKDLAILPDAEALFVKTLIDEGVSIEDALFSLKASREMGVSPSVSVTASVPQMQTQGYLMAKGSAGSRVAAQAVDDITERQIPILNEKLISEAVGEAPMTAEMYGKSVAAMAKKAMDEKRSTLLTRSKPYYAQSIGIDKSLNTANPYFQAAMENPLVVHALEGARKDPFTKTNVFKELQEYGIDVSDFEKLPYNSTVSLHAARTNLRQMADTAFSAGEKTKGAAIKKAINDIDAAIESEFPKYATARKIYSEDAGALKVLKESPVGQMAVFAEGDYSKIANQLMQKDPSYIRKTMFNMGRSGINENKMRQSVAGAFLRRQFEESGNDAVRFGANVFKNQGNRARLAALLGEGRVVQMEKVNSVIESLIDTKNIPRQSITSAAESVKNGTSIPIGKGDYLQILKTKLAPSLFDLVQKNPASAARYSELMFTDEGFKLLESLSANKKVTLSDMEKITGTLMKGSK